MRHGLREFDVDQYLPDVREDLPIAEFWPAAVPGVSRVDGWRADLRRALDEVRGRTVGLYWQASWPFDRRRAIAPHIDAPPTFSAYVGNRDPAMDAILAALPPGHGRDRAL